MHLRVLGPQSHDVHPAWCRLLRTVFTRADFARWIDWGQWDDSYRAYTMFDGEQPIANVSLTQMRLVLDGEERRGWQLGAVCVHPLPGVLVFCEQQGDCLTINEVLSEGDVDLAGLLPQLIEATIARLRFGFTPERLWPTARAIAVDPEPHLQVRGFAPRGPHKFPLLAQT
jgi:hypothetical protein